MEKGYIFWRNTCGCGEGDVGVIGAWENNEKCWCRGKNQNKKKGKEEMG